MLALCPGVCNTTLHPGADHGKFKLRKNRYQLQKRHRHGVRISGSAVDGDTADDLEADMFYPDYLNDCKTAGQTLTDGTAL